MKKKKEGNVNIRSAGTGFIISVYDDLISDTLTLAVTPKELEEIVLIGQLMLRK